MNRILFLYPVFLLLFLMVSLLLITDHRGETLTSLARLLRVHAPHRPADALVLLAGDNRTRLPAVARLFHQGAAPLVLLTNDGVFSGWSIKHQRNLYNVEWMEEELLRLGVPKGAMVKLSFQGSGTIYDALAAREFVKDSRIKRLLVVTSDYHTRRSLWTFRRVMPEKIEIGIFAVPTNATTGNEIQVVVLEYAKTFYYILRYGLVEGALAALP